MHFRKMDDFTPAAVARQVPSLAKLLQARDQLANLLRYMDGKVAAEDQIKMLLKDPQLMAALRDRAPAAAEQADTQPDDK
jgi:type VI secretion system protein ImpB